jgi:hypothetical protein
MVYISLPSSSKQTTRSQNVPNQRRDRPFLSPFLKLLIESYQSFLLELLPPFLHPVLLRAGQQLQMSGSLRQAPLRLRDQARREFLIDLVPFDQRRFLGRDHTRSEFGG